MSAPPAAVDPLERFALMYFQEMAGGPLNDPQRGALGSVLGLIRGTVSAGEASFAVREVFGTDAPVQKVLSILTMAPDPLPYFPSSDGRPSGTRQKPRPWTDHEDRRLIAAIRKYKLGKWGPISAFVGNGRSGSQCCQRWNRGLDPSIAKGPWTRGEEAELLALVAKFGEKAWKKIAREIGHRSDVQCKYCYQQMQKQTAWTRAPASAAPQRRLESGPVQSAADPGIAFEELSGHFFQQEEESWRDSFPFLAMPGSDQFGSSLSPDD
jgi:hypothetical protein